VANRTPSIRIGIYGNDCTWGNEKHGCGLWPAGLVASVTAAEGVPVTLEEPAGRSWGKLLEDVQGVVLAGHDGAPRRQSADAEMLCQWCQKHRIPLLAIDHGLHYLNTAHGGTVFFDLPRDLPEALQHRHPPERGLRHAINIVPQTALAELYGEGEVVVNSEHRRAVQRVARGFKVSAQALDGVIEAIESEAPDWWTLGVQWQPASPTASGLDIQLFRGLIDACLKRAGALVSAAA
jgi:putative glutamine amidotransferase